MKRKTGFLATAVVAVVLQGCTVLQKSVFSAPKISEGSGKVNDNAIRLEMSGLNLSVTAVYRPIIKELFAPWPLPPFIPDKLETDPNPNMIPSQTAFELRFDPEGEDVSFNPMRATLKTSDGKILKPTGFFGPGHGTYFPGLDPTRRMRYPCSSGENTPKSAEGSIPLNEATCFYLLFDKPPYPDMSFTLSLDGIQKSGKPFQIPAIHFDKGSAWVFGTVP